MRKLCMIHGQASPEHTGSWAGPRGLCCQLEGWVWARAALFFFPWPPIAVATQSPDHGLLLHQALITLWPEAMGSRKPPELPGPVPGFSCLNTLWFCGWQYLCTALPPSMPQRQILPSCHQYHQYHACPSLPKTENKGKMVTASSQHQQKKRMIGGEGKKAATDLGSLGASETLWRERREKLMPTCRAQSCLCHTDICDKPNAEQQGGLEIRDAVSPFEVCH